MLYVMVFNLPLQGCTTGRHNGVKPAEPEKKAEKPLGAGEVGHNKYLQSESLTALHYILCHYAHMHLSCTIVQVPTG